MNEEESRKGVFSPFVDINWEEKDNKPQWEVGMAPSAYLDEVNSDDPLCLSPFSLISNGEIPQLPPLPCEEMSSSPFEDFLPFISNDFDHFSSQLYDDSSSSISYIGYNDQMETSADDEMQHSMDYESEIEEIVDEEDDVEIVNENDHESPDHIIQRIIAISTMEANLSAKYLSEAYDRVMKKEMDVDTAIVTFGVDGTVLRRKVREGISLRLSQKLWRETMETSKKKEQIDNIVKRKLEDGKLTPLISSLFINTRLTMILNTSSYKQSDRDAIKRVIISALHESTVPNNNHIPIHSSLKLNIDILPFYRKLVSTLLTNPEERCNNIELQVATISKRGYKKIDMNTLL